MWLCLSVSHMVKYRSEQTLRNDWEINGFRVSLSSFIMVSQMMSFHLDGSESDSSLSSRVGSGSVGGELLCVARVAPVGAWIRAVDVDVDAAGSIRTTHESGVGGPWDGGGDVSDGGVSLGIPDELHGSLASRTVLGSGCLDDADDETHGCQHGGDDSCPCDRADSILARVSTWGFGHMGVGSADGGGLRKLTRRLLREVAAPVSNVILSSFLLSGGLDGLDLPPELVELVLVVLVVDDVMKLIDLLVKPGDLGLESVSVGLGVVEGAEDGAAGISVSLLGDALVAGVAALLQEVSSVVLFVALHPECILMLALSAVQDGQAQENAVEQLEDAKTAARRIADRNGTSLLKGDRDPVIEDVGGGAPVLIPGVLSDDAEGCVGALDVSSAAVGESLRVLRDLRLLRHDAVEGVRDGGLRWLP